MSKSKKIDFQTILLNNGVRLTEAGSTSVHRAMREACQKILELAAENTQSVWVTVGRESEGFVTKGEFDNPEDALALANKLNDSQNVFYYDYNRKPVVQAVIDTINQIK